MQPTFHLAQLGRCLRLLAVFRSRLYNPQIPAQHFYTGTSGHHCIACLLLLVATHRIIRHLRADFQQSAADEVLVRIHCHCSSCGTVSPLRQQPGLCQPPAKAYRQPYAAHLRLPLFPHPLHRPLFPQDSTSDHRTARHRSPHSGHRLRLHRNRKGMGLSVRKKRVVHL